MKKLIALVALIALVTVSAFATDTINPSYDTLEVILSVDGKTSCAFVASAPEFDDGTAYTALSATNAIDINLSSTATSGSVDAVVRTSSSSAFTATVTSTALSATINGATVIVPYTATIGSTSKEIKTAGTTEVGTFTVAAGTTTRQVASTFEAAVDADDISKAVSGTYTATVTLTVAANS